MKLRIEVESKTYEVTVEFLEDGHNAHRDWQPGTVEIPEAVTRKRAPMKLLEDTFCRSPINGRIAAVLAIPGQAMHKNEPVLVIEAMKMEIQIGPAVDGVLKTIQVKPGELVTSGQLLFEIA
jgi:biotin carboxyl carrier protein